MLRFIEHVRSRPASVRYAYTMGSTVVLFLIIIGTWLAIEDDPFGLGKNTGGDPGQQRTQNEGADTPFARISAAWSEAKEAMRLSPEEKSMRSTLNTGTSSAHSATQTPATPHQATSTERARDTEGTTFGNAATTVPATSTATTAS